MPKYQKPSPEQWEEKKRKWKEKVVNADAGTNPKDIQTFERAEKALQLLKMDFESGKAILTQEQREIYIALVVKKSTDDFYFFCKYVLGFNLMMVEPHKRWCVDLMTAIYAGKKRILRLKPRRTFKCLKKNTQLFNYGIDKDYNIVPAKLINQKDFIEDGIEIKFASGRKHICTKDHLFRTLFNWELPKVGMRVALVKEIPNPYIPVNEPEEYMMGLLVGDGCLIESTPKLSCGDKELLNTLKKDGFILNKISEDKYDYRVLKFSDKVRECGLEGTNSHTKFIPLKYEGSKYFLQGLFDADAYVDKRDCRIVFTTVSEKLADDVLRNLLYFGIVARKKIYHYEKSKVSPEINSFQISIYGLFVKEFAKKINFRANHKKERVNIWLNNTTVGTNATYNNIPPEWRKLLNYDDKHKIRYIAKLRIDNKYSTHHIKVKKCAEYLNNNKELLNLVDAPIYWDKIISIKEIGQVEFSAIGSDIENYISADGIIHHNTTVYGVGFILWVWGCINPSIRFFYTSVNKLLLDEVADSVSQYVGSDKNESFYSYLFGVTKDLNVKNTTDVFNIQGREGKGFSLILRTSGGNTVGIHPNIIMIDDPLGVDDQKYETERKSKELWFDTLIPLLTPFFDMKTGLSFESIFYIGTRWHMKDLVNYIEEKLVKKKGQYWDIESESITVDGTPDGAPSYPDFFPADKIKEIRNSMSSEFFAAQMLNRPQSLDTVVFDLNRLHFVRPDQFEQIKHKGQILCAFDPSLGKSSGDYPAVAFLHQYENVITLFDAIDKKIEIAVLLNLIAEKCKLHNCKVIRFETNNAILMEENMKIAFGKIEWRMTYDPIHHGADANKRQRIVSMQPDLYSGSVQFMDDYEERYPEFIRQIIFYGSWDHDDCPDVLELGLSYFKQPHFQFIRYDEML